MSDLPAAPDAEAAYLALRESLRQTLRAAASPPRLVGIHSGGAWIAQRLHAELAPGTPLGLSSGCFLRLHHRPRQRHAQRRRQVPARGLPSHRHLCRDET